MQTADWREGLAAVSERRPASFLRALRTPDAQSSSRPAGDIRYQVAAAAVPPLLLTHGYAATAAMFAANVPAIAARHHVITWDMRGHGGSDYPAEPASYSPAAALDDMAALLAELRAGPGRARRPLAWRIPVAGFRAHLPRTGSPALVPHRYRAWLPQ